MAYGGFQVGGKPKGQRSGSLRGDEGRLFQKEGWVATERLCNIKIEKGQSDLATLNSLVTLK